MTHSPAAASVEESPPCLWTPLFSRRNPARKRSPLSTTPLPASLLPCPPEHQSAGQCYTTAAGECLASSRECHCRDPSPIFHSKTGDPVQSPLSFDHCCRETAVFEEEFGVCCGAPRAIAANKKRLPPTTQRTSRPWAGSRSRPEGTTIRSAPRASAAPGSTRRLEGKPLCLLQRSDIAAKAARLQPSTPARGCLPLQRRHDRPDHRRLPITVSVC